MCYYGNPNLSGIFRYPAEADPYTKHAKKIILDVAEDS